MFNAVLLGKRFLSVLNKNILSSTLSLALTEERTVKIGAQL